MPEKFAVGVDFGGTKIIAGVVNLETGRLAGTGKKKTRQVSEQDDVLRRLTSVIDESMAEAGVDPKCLAGIGIGAAGQVNRAKGVLVYAANIGINDLPLAGPLSEHYGLPCMLGNDVEIATIGELNFGAGRKCDNFVCIFVGTGIGSGIVQGGQLYRGATGTAGEIGHIVLDPYGRLCGCGCLGCLEAYASRTAIAKHVVAELNKGTDSVVRDRIDVSKGILRSKALADAVEAKDEMVVRAVTQAAEFMGMGLATVMNFLNPQRIVLGGGLIEAVDLYFQVAAKEAKQRALKVPARKIEIVKAELGDYAGIIGAALMLRDRTD
ncbi:MAG: ROK family protein [Candidatus Melainabacteria bacterium]|nr:ROK family protein [Candidatus Melainabacteria bacterium]